MAKRGGFVALRKRRGHSLLFCAVQNRHAKIAINNRQRYYYDCYQLRREGGTEQKQQGG